MIQTVIFDLDDTLIETGALFRETLDLLTARLRARLGAAAPSAETILARQEKIDLVLLEQCGITPERYAQSFVLTCREFLGDRSSAEEEEFLHAQALRAFHDVPALSPGAVAVLDALAARELIIYTWGFPEIQMPRIRALGLERRFAAIHCVPQKSPAILREILAGRNPAATLVVGDSLRGEVAPAVALGCHAALIERPHTWSIHHAEVPGEYHRLARLADLPELVAQLDGVTAG